MEATSRSSLCYKSVKKTTAIFICRSRTRCRCRSEILTSLIKSDKNDKVIWEVRVKNIINERISVEEFDSVIVAVGLFSVPRIPEITGLELFEGKIIHSHDYRIPEKFSNMPVLVIGGLFSGQDISVDVAKCAKYVLFSHRKPKLARKLPGNLRQCGPIQHLTIKSAVLADGDECQIDALILCTGYKRDLSFLSPECRVKVENECLYPPSL